MKGSAVMTGIAKKLLLLIMIYALVITAGGCLRAPQISKSASADNFIKYEKAIRAIAKKHDLAIEELEPVLYDGYDASRVSKEFSLSGGKGMHIYISLSNDALDMEPEGEETFYISYTLPFAEDYDLYLFTELINAVSGETVTTDFCRDFLRGLEIDLSPPRVRYTIIFKSKPLDFGEHWIISYDLSGSDYSESYRQDLTFTGLTKAGF